MHAGRLFLVDRGGQTQASIAVGEVGIDLLDPDSFALDVLGDIMNGFGGRLFDELRSKEVQYVCSVDMVYAACTQCIWHLDAVHIGNMSDSSVCLHVFCLYNAAFMECMCVQPVSSMYTVCM